MNNTNKQTKRTCYFPAYQEQPWYSIRELQETCKDKYLLVVKKHWDGDFCFYAGRMDDTYAYGLLFQGGIEQDPARFPADTKEFRLFDPVFPSRTDIFEYLDGWYECGEEMPWLTETTPYSHEKEKPSDNTFSSIEELRLTYGYNDLVVVRNTWNNDFCFLVESIEDGYAYGIQFLNGQPYRENVKYDIHTKEFRLYDGPSMDDILWFLEMTA